MDTRTHEPDSVRGRLIERLNALDRYQIWRSVYDEEGNLLAAGHADPRDGPAEAFAKYDFRGKTVMEVGCNVGHHLLMVKRMGAAAVIGLDIDADVLEVCRLLAQLHGWPDMSFYHAEFTEFEAPFTPDVVMSIGVIGKKRVGKGMDKVLGNLRDRAGRAVILTLSESYPIDRIPTNDRQGLIDLYGPQFIDRDHVLVVDYVRSFFEPDWSFTLLSGDGHRFNVKRTLLFERR